MRLCTDSLLTTPIASSSSAVEQVRLQRRNTHSQRRKAIMPRVPVSAFHTDGAGRLSPLSTYLRIVPPGRLQPVLTSPACPRSIVVAP